MRLQGSVGLANRIISILEKQSQDETTSVPSVIRETLSTKKKRKRHTRRQKVNQDVIRQWVSEGVNKKISKWWYGIVEPESQQTAVNTILDVLDGRNATKSLKSEIPNLVQSCIMPTSKLPFWDRSNIINSAELSKRLQVLKPTNHVHNLFVLK